MAMRKFGLWVLMLAMVCSAFAQTAADQEQARRADEILGKMRTMELTNQILPLLLTMEQLRELLPPIEKARQAVKAAKAEEFSVLKMYEGKLDTAIKNATEKGQIPGREMLLEMNRVLTALGMKRRAIADENIATVLAAAQKLLNAGQLKAAANSLDPKLFDPTLKVEEMKEIDKVRFFVGEVMLDPLAYDILVKLSR